ncbi:MAG TPA: tetratricopeptide repeat protein [Polyangiaceae bacterium]
MFAVGDAAWRVVVLLGLALAPWGEPVEATGAPSMGVLLLRLAVFLVVLAAALVGLRKAVGRYPGVAALGALTLAAAPIVSAVCRGAEGPLGRGVWAMAPLAWATVAAVVGGPVVDRFGGGKGRGRVGAFAGAVVLILGGASLFFARAKIGSREALWTAALAVDPGNEDAAVAVAAMDRAKHDRTAAWRALSECARVRPGSCGCAEGGAAEAIDAGRYLDARQLLEASDVCARTPRRTALRAEALVGTDSLEEGLHEAERTLERTPDEPHAVYARAWATVLKGRPLDARADAEKAVALGRGIPAELLLGLLLYQVGDLAGADAQFQRVLTEDPQSAAATYDHALVADRQGRYHDAREGYLHAIQLDPKNADARYNLVVLTHGHGATLESQHHFEVFTATFPTDPRIGALRNLVATVPPVKAMSFP